MKSDAAPIRLAGLDLRQQRHAWAFFNSDEESYRVPSSARSSGCLAQGDAFSSAEAFLESECLMLDIDASHERPGIAWELTKARGEYPGRPHHRAE